MPVSLLRISRLKCSEQFWELKMAKRNTIREPAVDTGVWGNWATCHSRPTRVTQTTTFSLFLLSFSLTFFLTFIFTQMFVCVYLALLLYIYPSAFRSSFFLLACFLSLLLPLPVPLATTLLFLHLSIPFSSKPVNFSLHLGGSVSIPGRCRCDMWLNRSAWKGLSQSRAVFSCHCL